MSQMSLASANECRKNFIFIFGGCILLRSLLGLHYSGRHSQQSFLLSPSTHSLHILARAGHLQVNILFSFLPLEGNN
jgi:hypothetical protein